VYRPATDEILEGQINGRELEFVSNGSNGGGDSANNSGDATPAASGDEFVVVTDDMMQNQLLSKFPLAVNMTAVHGRSVTVT